MTHGAPRSGNQYRRYSGSGEWPRVRRLALSVFAVLALFSVTQVSASAQTEAPSSNESAIEALVDELTLSYGDVPPGLETQGNANTYVLLDSTDSNGPTYNNAFAPTSDPGLDGFDDAVEVVPLGFTFDFHGNGYTDAFINTNGFLTFAPTTASWINNDLSLDMSLESQAILAWWDDLAAEGAGTSIRYDTFGSPGDRVFVVRYVVAHGFLGGTDYIDFDIRLFEANGRIEFHYHDVTLGDAGFDSGAAATVGLREDGPASGFLQYSHNTADLDAGMALRLWEPTCGGAAVTWVGTRGFDVFFDLDNVNDVAYAHHGNDALVGGDGDDLLCGGEGDDVIHGGDGVDVIYGSLGVDRLMGELDNDTIYGGGGNDDIEGGDGNDDLYGGSGSDTLTGSLGDDRLFGQAQNDVLDGGAGDDDLFGSIGIDTLIGGFGADLLNGGAGADDLSGGPDNDLIVGGGGNDIIVGGAGDDDLRGGAGDDTVDGFAGEDTITGGGGNDDLYGGRDIDVIIGGPGDDHIQGGNAADTLTGNGGDDTIYGGTGDDILAGSGGNDLIHGDPGNDTIIGGPGVDTLYGSTGNDDLAGNGADDVLDGGIGTNTLDGGGGTDTCISGTPTRCEL